MCFHRHKTSTSCSSHAYCLQSKGAPFIVDVPENRYHVVSSWDHIKEIDAAPDGVLSLQGAAKEILQPKHTMTNFNWLDKRGADGAPLLKTLRTDLNGHLPTILPEIRRSMSGLLDRLHNTHQIVDGEHFIESCKSSLRLILFTQLSNDPRCILWLSNPSPSLTPWHSLERILVSGCIIRPARQDQKLMPDSAQNEDFLGVGSDFIEQTLIIAEVCRLLPDVISE